MKIMREGNRSRPLQSAGLRRTEFKIGGHMTFHDDNRNPANFEFCTSEPSS
jgi:hypothetical protein